jgi:hypothetical protein
VSIFLFIISCIFSGIPSYGNVDTVWRNLPPAEVFLDAIKPSKNLGSFNAHRQEVESMIDRIPGARAHVSYYTWDILKNGGDKSAFFTLAPDILADLTKNVTPCAVKIFAKASGEVQNLWEHPFDTSNPPSPNRPACASLPNGFLIRHYDKTSSDKNEPFDLSKVRDGTGFTFLVLIPGEYTTQHTPRCLIIRARIRITNSPQNRFVKMIDPQLKIENVSGDGNCAFWAVLRSLKELRDRNSGRDIGNFEVIPGTFNAAHPSVADYQLMNKLRRATSGKAKETFVLEAFNGIRRHFANAFSLPTSIDNVASGQERLPMAITIPPSINLSQVNLHELHELSSALSRLDNNMYRWDLFAQVNSSTGSSLREFQLEAANNLLAETNPERYQYLTSMDSSELWLVVTDIPYLVKAIGLPLLVVYPKDDNHGLGHFTGEYGCYFYDNNGQTLLRGDGNEDTQRIAELLRAYPDTVKIYYNGTNHYQAIIKE